MAIPTDNLTDKGFNASTRHDTSGADISFDKDPRNPEEIDFQEDIDGFEIEEFEADHLSMK